MSETLGRAEQVMQKESREAQWALVEMQMAAWNERASKVIAPAPGLEREREHVHQRVMEWSR